MSVLNMFQEDDNPVITKPVKETKPAYAFEPDPNWGQEPITDLPGDSQYAQTKMEVVQPEPTREELLKAKMDEMYKTGFNPMLALIDQGTPQLDEQKAKRLKFAAATNALGQVLSTLFGGVMGAKGGPILEQRNEFTPAALEEYKQRVEADKDAKFRNAMAKSQLAGKVFEMANNELNQDEQRRFSRETQKLSQEFTAEENEKQRQAAILAAKNRSGGKSVEDELAVINARYDRMAEIEAIKAARMSNLESLKQSGKITQAEYNAQKRKDLEEYKAQKTKVTEETESFDNGQAKKTKTETTTIPPANPKKEKTEEEKLKEMGIVTKGKLLKK